jgi:hypothetical protein
MSQIQFHANEQNTQKIRNLWEGEAEYSKIMKFLACIPVVWCRIFGGLINDIRHRYRHYLTDFTHGLHPQCLASTIFLFFACITPIVTFGGLMGQKTEGYMVCVDCFAAFFEAH